MHYILWLSYPHERNMRNLYIPKFTLRYICMKSVLILRSQCKFSSHKSLNGMNATTNYYFLCPPPPVRTRLSVIQTTATKYCWAYSGIFIHRTPKYWNTTMKMTQSNEGPTMPVTEDTNQVQLEQLKKHCKCPLQRTEKLNWDRTIHEPEYIFIGKILWMFSLH